VIDLADNENGGRKNVNWNEEDGMKNEEANGGNASRKSTKIG
jgi:hypothetical protein